MSKWSDEQARECANSILESAETLYSDFPIEALGRAILDLRERVELTEAAASAEAEQADEQRKRAEKAEWERDNALAVNARLVEDTKNGTTQPNTAKAAADPAMAQEWKAPSTAQEPFRPDWKRTLPEAAIPERLEQCEAILFWLTQAGRVPGDIRHRIVRFFKGRTPSIVAVFQHKERALHQRCAALEAALKRIGSMEAFGLPLAVNKNDALWPELEARMDHARAALSGDTSALRVMLLQMGGLVWAMAAPDAEVDTNTIKSAAESVMEGK